MPVYLDEECQNLRSGLKYGRATNQHAADEVVAQLDALIRADHGAEGSYQLLAGFPPSPLADPAASVEAAGLKGASVTQKAA